MTMNKTGPLLLLLLLYLSPTTTSVIFNAILLMDSSSFSSDAFSSLVQSTLLLTDNTAVTIHSIESDTITGAQGKSLFENSSSFYNFQLLHITRVRTSVRTDDELTASVIIRRSLPHEAAQHLLHGMTSSSGVIMGIESVEFGEVSPQGGDPSLFLPTIIMQQKWFTTTYLELPSFAAQYLICGWVLTVLSFMLCVLCYCCCCGGSSSSSNNNTSPSPHAVGVVVQDNNNNNMENHATTTTTVVVSNGRRGGVPWPVITPPPQQQQTAAAAVQLLLLPNGPTTTTTRPPPISPFSTPPPPQASAPPPTDFF